MPPKGKFSWTNQRQWFPKSATVFFVEVMVFIAIKNWFLLFFRKSPSETYPYHRWYGYSYPKDFLQIVKLYYGHDEKFPFRVEVSVTVISTKITAADFVNHSHWFCHENFPFGGWKSLSRIDGLLQTLNTRSDGLSSCECACDGKSAAFPRVRNPYIFQCCVCTNTTVDLNRQGKMPCRPPMVLGYWLCARMRLRVTRPRWCRSGRASIHDQIRIGRRQNPQKLGEIRTCNVSAVE